MCDRVAQRRSGCLLHAASVLRLDHVGLAARSLDDAGSYLEAFGIRMHVEHRAGWAPIGPDQYLHVLPAGEDTFLRRQIAMLLDADVRWSSWSVTALPDELRALPVGADLEEGQPMRIGELEYLTNDGGLTVMLQSGGALPYCSAYFSPGMTTATLVEAMGGATDGLNGVVELTIGGDGDRLRSWLGGTEAAAIELVEGPPGLHCVTVATASGIVELDCGPLAARNE